MGGGTIRNQRHDCLYDVVYDSLSCSEVQSEFKFVAFFLLLALVSLVALLTFGIYQTYVGGLVVTLRARRHLIGQESAFRSVQAFIYLVPLFKTMQFCLIACSLAAC